MHLVGAAAKRVTGVRWVADVRDSMLRNADRPVERLAARAKERTQETIARLIARYADSIVVVADAYADEIGSLSPRGPVSVVPNGADFDDFAGIDYRPNGRFRVTHTGAMFGKRDPRPFLTAFARADLDRPSRASSATSARPTASGSRSSSSASGSSSTRTCRAGSRSSSSATRRRCSCSCPRCRGAGSGVIAAKVFEYLAAERPIIAAVPPDGATADFVREAGAGTVVPPDDVDAIEAALRDLHARWTAGSLDGTPLAPELRTKLDRRTRAEEFARVLRDAT